MYENFVNSEWKLWTIKQNCKICDPGCQGLWVIGEGLND